MSAELRTPESKIHIELTRSEACELLEELLWAESEQKLTQLQSMSQPRMIELMAGLRIALKRIG